MKAQKQRNSHARSKRKRKILRLKNRMRSIIEKRSVKQNKAYEGKGKTFKRYVNKEGQMVTAKDVALRVTLDTKGVGGLFDTGHAKSLNQRQKRKRYRQSHHCS